MAYAVNWTTKVVTIPLTDLTFVSGTNYTLDAADVWIELRRLEASPTDGLWADQIAEFVNTQVLSGLSYSAILKMINGYTWNTDTSNKTISLLGINNNLLDTFIPGNGISVLANNSGGKITVDGGASAITQQDKDDIENQVHTRIMENGETFEEQVRLIRAEAAGTIVKTGDVHEIKSADSLKTRITATANED
ncbi:MAG: hypothetical protein ACYSSM_02390, partial [Planctomycetota bacterium]